MPTKIRTFANSKIYHIIIKGIDDQNIFYDNQDRNMFLNHLKTSQEKFKFKIYSYCLMSNHVHLVIKSEKELLSKSIQSLLIKYVNYFNKKYQRKGHLVQDRFKSKIVESRKYFLDVCRYVHRNPEKAGISKTQNYKWSSYQAYIQGSELVDTKMLLHYFNNDIQEFIKFTVKNDNVYADLEEFTEYEMLNRLSDNQLADIIMKRFNIINIEDLSCYFKDLSLMQLKSAIKTISKIKGINKTQVARVIRVSRKIIEKFW